MSGDESDVILGGLAVAGSDDSVVVGGVDADARLPGRRRPRQRRRGRYKTQTAASTPVVAYLVVDPALRSESDIVEHRWAHAVGDSLFSHETCGIVGLLLVSWNDFA